MENKKTLVNYVLILSGILVILLLVIFFISNRISSSNKSNQSNLVYPTPTSYLFYPTTSSYPLNFKNKNLSPSSTPSLTVSSTVSPSPSIPIIPASNFTGVKEVEVDPKVAASTNDSFALKTKLPLEKNNLKIDFDYEKEVFVISPINAKVSISDKEKQELLDWLKKNYPSIDQQKITYSNTPFVSPTPKKININITPIVITTSPPPNFSENSFSVFRDLFKIILNEQNLQTNLPIDISPYPNISLTQPNNQMGAGFPQINYTPPQTQYPYIYYPQCSGPFDKYPLPGGCDICYAGCGPTTVAMIVASYKNKSVNPITIVNQYGTKVGCDGSSYLDAMNVLRSYGINVGSLIFSTGYYDGKKAEEIAPELKKYISAGKTIFVLANFRADGGGHFFWIIDVDEKNNFWAFDPYYGRFKIPYNENSRYPYPLYRLAFPVSH